MQLTATDHTEALGLAEQLARAIREPVSIAINDDSAGRVSGVASSGDTTYAADDVAEDATEAAVLALGTPIMLYTEDRGLRQFGSDPRWLAVVDPIDGTRPASAGFEACVVSVAIAPAIDGATMGDVAAGAVYELRRDRLYTASKSASASMQSDGRSEQLMPKPPPDFRQLRWTLETVARPAVANFTAASLLIDETSLMGSVFAFNSSAFAICQIASGYLSGMVDLSARLVHDLPDGISEARRVGDGRVMGMWAYDIAAAALIARQAGCHISDAWGRPLDSLKLTRTEPEDMASSICAPSADYQARMVELIDAGFRSLRP